LVYIIKKIDDNPVGDKGREELRLLGEYKSSGFKLFY